MSRFRLRGCHPLRRAFPGPSATVPSRRCRRSYNPARCVATPAVWALPLSLATTRGIIVIFSSCGYLDVSVPHVRSALKRCDGIASAGFPHSDIGGSAGICPSPPLFAACHVLLRLREPQASPMRPSLLSFFLSPIQPVFLVSFLVRHVNGGDALDFRLDFKVISYSFSFASQHPCGSC